MSEILKRGDRIRHLKKMDWGIGEVVSDRVGDGFIEVMFENDGFLRLDSDPARFEKISGESNRPDYLDDLVNSYRGGLPQKKENSFKAATRKFKREFPLGFNDPKYLVGPGNERQDKLDLHDLMNTLLNKEVFSSLLKNEDFGEIYDRSYQIVKKGNLTHHIESAKFFDAIKSQSKQRIFSEQLFDLVYGQSELKQRFTAFAKMDNVTWPLMTIFPFIAFPESQIFIKPEVTKKAAEVFGVEINYRPIPNWLTYLCIQELVKKIFDKLRRDGIENLNPRDMIDVQSFIWVIGH